MSFAVVSSLYPHTRPPCMPESVPAPSPRQAAAPDTLNQRSSSSRRFSTTGYSSSAI
jgi:hypothetical protein